MKKDIKYIIKRVVIGVLIVLILSFIKSCNVNADTIVKPQVGLTFNNQEMEYISVGASSSGSNYNIKVAVSEKTPAYFILDVCTSADYNNFYISNSSCNNSCINDGEITAYRVGSCQVYGVTADRVLLQMQVNKYEIDPVSTYYLANSRIYFSGYSYQSVVRVLNYYASDDDMITQFANTQKNVQNIINIISGSATNITNSQQETTDAINDLNDTIKDGSIPNDTNSKISNITDAITANQNSNIVQLATFIPQTLQVILNGFNDSCTGGYSLGSLYGTELILPCINPVDYLGSFLWGVIDSILCLCYLIPLCKFLVNKYNDLTSLKNMRWE